MLSSSFSIVVSPETAIVLSANSSRRESASSLSAVSASIIEKSGTIVLSEESKLTRETFVALLSPDSQSSIEADKTFSESSSIFKFKVGVSFGLGSKFSTNKVSTYSASSISSEEERYKSN